MKRPTIITSYKQSLAWPVSSLLLTHFASQTDAKILINVKGYVRPKMTGDWVIWRQAPKQVEDHILPPKTGERWGFAPK